MVGEHKPRGVTTCDCGIPAIAHRPSHNPLAWPVCSCGARSENHRVKHQYRPGCCQLSEERHLSHGRPRLRGARGPYKHTFVGIDGEGVGRHPHKYILLCAAALDGPKWSLDDPDGIGSLQALTWLVNTLDNCRVFAYGFGYDITMILKDLPNNTIYLLHRPHLRVDKGKIRPVHWQGFSLDLLQGKLTISKGKKRVAIWDIQKFYQQSFVASLIQWGIATEDIEHMKAKRSTFRLSQLPAIREYCQTECRQLAELASRLLTAHKSSGLTLKAYYGPGSTASTALGLMKVKEYQKEPPDKMATPIACAFSGGRFEHSFMGIVDDVYAYDISSAYPYHAYHLPCLLHGRWKHIRLPDVSELRDSTTALVRYRYRGKPTDVWAPFPHRDIKGTICYPYINEGWVWLPEYLAGKNMGRTHAIEAWVYKTNCECHPFASISDYYRRRVELEKDARGKVLKLAVNSVYGKLAQSKGQNPPYQNWIWAGLITSGTRAQVLQAFQSTDDIRNILAIATDGIFSRCPLQLPHPQDTGTSDLSQPLGGWEEKHHSEGVLFLKPGVYFSLTGGITIKARGIGRKTMLEESPEILAAWRRGDTKYTVTVDRFHGAKSCILKDRRSERFGEWTKDEITMSFRCPNRTETMGLLAKDESSAPYNSALLTPEVLAKEIHGTMMYEQP